MPAPQRYPAPHEQLLLLARRARAEGLTFDEFWARAVPPQRTRDGKPLLDKNDLPLSARRLPRVKDEEPPEGAVLWPNDTHDRKMAYAAILASEEGWRSAYEGRPQENREAALGELAPLLERAFRSGGPVASAA